jgi:hypothetical protein
MSTAAIDPVATVQIGARPSIHAMADGSGPVPRGRARCEIDKRTMTYRPYCEMRANGLGIDRDRPQPRRPARPRRRHLSVVPDARLAAGMSAREHSSAFDEAVGCKGDIHFYTMPPRTHRG